MPSNNTKKTPKRISQKKGTATKLVDSKLKTSNRNLPVMLEKYKNEVVPEMKESFSYTNTMQIPKIEKIFVNIGMGETVQDKNALSAAISDLTMITGQKPRENKAKKSVANFKLREGMIIGVSVTLRRDRMWDFFDRLVNIALPRIRDFRGINPKSFDGNGNYSLGLREQVTFPEINYTEVDKLRGLQVTINTTAKTDKESKRLLELLGVPFAG
ncbi:MAG: 50S ribosomal protein L5 [Chloroflexi bacterium]|nr:50S ribosomal protein L5 [Chloroflexota bacterium]